MLPEPKDRAGSDCRMGLCMSTFPQGQGFLPDQEQAIQNQETARKFHSAIYRANDALARAGDAAVVYDFGNVNRPYVHDQLKRAHAAIREANMLLFGITHFPEVAASLSDDPQADIDTDVIPRPDADFLQLTFKDNELLPERERENILNYYNQGYNEDGSIKDAYWANKWQVYGLGNIGNLQGVVFSNWQICDEIPEHANTLCYAMDFGFTNDPTALIQVFKHDGMLWLDELVYERGLTNPDIVSKLVEYGVTGPIVADSAEPKSIEEIRRMWSGDIEPAEKGPDSIRNSIDTLHRYKLMVTKTSLNLINELRSYRWREDKSGNSLNEPIDKNNHAIDAVRYAALNYIGNPSIFEVY